MEGKKMSEFKRPGALGLVAWSVVLSAAVCQAGLAPTGDAWLPFTPSGDTVVGWSDVGTLRIDEGSYLGDANGYVGRRSGATGTVTVSGAGSNWTNTSLYLGYGGHGDLTIENGAQVNSTDSLLGFETGSTFAARVSGSGSSWNSTSLSVAVSGSGALSLEAGGKVLPAASSYIGYNAGSSGTVNVSGAGSNWKAASGSNIYVGYQGTGTVNVSAGGRVDEGKTYLGYAAGSSGNILLSGVDSTWVANRNISVGYLGSGAVTVTQGARLTASGWIGEQPGSMGRVDVSGAGSTWNGGNNLGFWGNALVNIEEGATFKTDGTLTFGWYAQGSGTLNISGAGSSMSGTTYSRIGLRGSGSLNIRDGAQVTDWYGALGEYAGSTGTALVSGAGSNWSNTGVIYVGRAGTGSLRIESGAAVNSDWGYIGEQAGSRGTAVVTGPGSRWSNGTALVVGFGGEGSLTVSNGAVVTARHLFASIDDLHGDGSITATEGGIVDAQLDFDATHGWTTALGFGSGGRLDLTFLPGKTHGVGYKNTGTMRIADRMVLSSDEGYLGYNPGSSGAATVSGAGSKWAVAGGLYVGRLGSGKLNVSSGGAVSAATLYAPLSDLDGDGTITVTNGAILDADLVFDGTHGTTQTLAFGNGGRLNVTFPETADLGAGYRKQGSIRISPGGFYTTSRDSYLGYHPGSKGVGTVKGHHAVWITKEQLNVGYSGTGILSVEAGGMVISNRESYLGYDPGSAGTMVITGDWSRWSSASELNIGYKGAGRLDILSGGKVDCKAGWVGRYEGSVGVVRVRGTGSAWDVSEQLSVGNGGSAVLMIEDGAKVSCQSLGINSQSALNLRVSGNKMLVVGSSTVTGSIGVAGRLSLYADVLLAAGTYTPITEYAGRPISWTGSGKVLAVGGTWNSSAMTLTVAAKQFTAAGATTPIAAGERWVFTDDASGRWVGASFGSVEPGVTFSASPMSWSLVEAVVTLLRPDQSVAGAWEFSTNYSGGGEVLMSMEVGPGISVDDMTVWHLENGVWSAYTPAMLSIDGSGVASFTVTSFSGYAIAVPEPSTTGLLVAAAMTLAARPRRQSRLQFPG